MTICADGHQLTLSEYKAAPGKVAGVIDTLKAAHHLPPQTITDMKPAVYGYVGVYQLGPKVRVEWDQPLAACMTGDQITAVTLHEARHLQQVSVQDDRFLSIVDNATPVFLAFAVLATILRLFKFSVGKDWYQFTPDFKQAGVMLALWAAGGTTLLEDTRHREIDADLYATRVMGSPNASEMALWQSAGYRRTMDFATPAQRTETIKSFKDNDAFTRRAWRFVMKGPLSLNVNDHPSDFTRIRHMEAERSKIKAAARQRASMHPHQS